jgi:hypothetical protein
MYPWYDIVEGAEILQGDFLKSCPVIIPPKKIEPGGRVPVDVIEYDVVIMSQSCDLVQAKIELVLVCPVWPLSLVESKSEFFKSKKGKEQLRQGNVPGYHLLNKCEKEGFMQDFMVVDFHNVYGISLDFVINFVRDQGKRLRLLSPYREHLSQAFARFFMRVGLPADIPRFT